MFQFLLLSPWFFFLMPWFQIVSHIINASGSVNGVYLPSSRAGITGIVGSMVFIFILLSFRFKNTHFNLFAIGHIVGAPLMVVMCVMHANSVSWWMLPTVFLYCCDKGFVTNEKFTFPIRTVEVLPGNAVLMKFDCVPLLQFTPGQWDLLPQFADWLVTLGPSSMLVFTH